MVLMLGYSQLAGRTWHLCFSTVTLTLARFVIVILLHLVMNYAIIKKKFHILYSLL